MHKLALLCLLSISSIGSGLAQTPGAPPPKGLVLCTLTGSKTYKPVKSTRDIDRRIAAALDAVKVDDKGIDLAIVERKLRDEIGNNPVICRLTLRPNGQVEEVTVLDSSGSSEADKKAIALLQKIKQYGPCRESRENLSYQVEMPKLYSFLLQPYGNKLFKRVNSSN